MSFSQRIEHRYRVRFDEAGPDGRLRSSGYLRYAQDLAWIHSESAGFDRRWYAQRGLTWLVRAIELEIVSEADYGSEIEVSTEVVGFRRVWARRRSDFRAAGHERLAAVAITDWVLLNAAGRPVQPPPEILAAFAAGAAAYTPVRLGKSDPPSDTSRREFAVRRSELDPMGHVNNAAYLDLLDEHYLGAQRLRHGLPVPRRYTAEFLLSAESGAALISTGWSHGSAWQYRLDDGDGHELFRARLETDSAAWVGGLTSGRSSRPAGHPAFLDQ